MRTVERFFIYSDNFEQVEGDSCGNCPNLQCAERSSGFHGTVISRHGLPRIHSLISVHWED
ncbi:rCG33183 [Rattus norvegicus]|uniref:RCG33183 n=1 Tax=Rattus norvegicus TaxID=10116 RepID=A6HIL1_RAT|nr:rCG33183 [Rattus norvegicus]